MKQVTLLFLFVIVAINSIGKSNIALHSDQPYLSRQKLFQLVYISSDTSECVNLKFRTYLFSNSNDSTCVLYHVVKKVKLKESITKVRFCFSQQDTIKEYSEPYYEIVRKTGNVAPGRYKTIIQLTDTNGNIVAARTLLQLIDSSFSACSALRSDINKKLTPSSRINKLRGKAKGYASRNAINNSSKRLDKLSKDKGLTHILYERDGKSYADFYYHNWFAGRYTVESEKPLKDHLLQQRNLNSAVNTNAIATTDLEMHPSLVSQFKGFKKQRDDDHEVKGEIAVSGTTANGQEPNSGIDNNYIETRARVDLPILNLPMEIEGLYTSQDAGRKIKTSYVHVHYDVEKVKDEMIQFVNSYNQKFSETKSKGVGMQQVYRGAIASLEGQKQRLDADVRNQLATQQKELETVNKETGNGLPDTGAIRANAVNNASQDAEERKQKAVQEKERLDEKVRKIEALDKKIERYKTLLEQDKNTNYFDSAIGYSKTAGINSNMSYKQMAKRSSDLLPDGATKKFVTGLTNLDAGMFSHYSSKYTMSGQMVKGINVGYDFGFCETGLTVGKTQYIGRDGSLDNYTCYSGRVGFKAAANQKISLIYYGYSPQRKQYSGDGFFSNMNVATPTFFQPVHIVSVNYDGVISKYVTLSSEVATTLKNGQNGNGDIKEKTGMHLEANGTLPWYSIQTQLSFDKTGKEFENNTLPVTLKGTEQYKVATTADLFRSFVTVGVDFNYLIQSSLAYSGSNTKWGFMIRTHSKRYPALSVSYKPYSTFRTFSDTFNIPQRPLFGSVLTSKASYQFKKNDYSLRFSLIYNSSKTAVDTVSYGNKLLQAMCTYTDKEFSGTIMSGYTKQYGSGTDATVPSSMSFLNLIGSCALGKEVSISAGGEIGITTFGLCRYTLNGGTQVTPKNKPVSIRLNLRAGEYKLEAKNKWSALYGGNLELAYKFKSKTNRKNNNF